MFQKVLSLTKVVPETNEKGKGTRPSRSCTPVGDAQLQGPQHQEANEESSGQGQILPGSFSKYGGGGQGTEAETHRGRDERLPKPLQGTPPHRAVENCPAGVRTPLGLCHGHAISEQREQQRGGHCQGHFRPSGAAQGPSAQPTAGGAGTVFRQSA